MLHNLLRQPDHANDIDIEGVLQALARQLCEVLNCLSLPKYGSTQQKVSSMSRCWHDILTYKHAVSPSLRLMALHEGAPKV